MLNKSIIFYKRLNISIFLLIYTPTQHSLMSCVWLREETVKRERGEKNVKKKKYVRNIVVDLCIN